MRGFRAQDWDTVQSVGTWAVALGLTVYEGVVRHFADQAGVWFLGGLLGLPIAVAVDRKRKRQREARNAR